MKKTLLILLSLAAIILNSCGEKNVIDTQAEKEITDTPSSQNAENEATDVISTKDIEEESIVTLPTIGETVSNSIFEVTVTDFQFGDVLDCLLGDNDEPNEQYLLPIDNYEESKCYKTLKFADLKNLYQAEEGNIELSYTLTIKNLTKKDLCIKDIMFELDYDNGYIFDHDHVFFSRPSLSHKSSLKCKTNTSWENSDSFIIPMLDKNTYTLRGAMELPKEVAENINAPLVLNLTYDYATNERIKIKLR